MRRFYLTYSKIPDASGILGWSHYCELIAIKDENKRNFYEKETINSKWSVRELQRQIETSLFERLLLSDGKANKEKVLQLAKEGQILNSPEDMIKDPFVFEFLGVPEKKPLKDKKIKEIFKISPTFHFFVVYINNEKRREWSKNSNTFIRHIEK